MGGVCLHVINRVNAKAQVLHKPHDCDALVVVLREAAERIAVCVPTHGQTWVTAHVVNRESVRNGLIQ